MGEFDGYTLVPTSNLRRIADELGMEGGIYAPKLRREVLAYIEVSPSLFAEAQPPAVGLDVSESLPALPKPWGADYDDIDNEEVETFTASQMKAYARAALTAALRTGGGE